MKHAKEIKRMERAVAALGSVVDELTDLGLMGRPFGSKLMEAVTIEMVEHILNMELSPSELSAFYGEQGHA